MSGTTVGASSLIMFVSGNKLVEMLTVISRLLAACGISEAGSFQIKRKFFFGKGGKRNFFLRKSPIKRKLFSYSKIQA